MHEPETCGFCHEEYPRDELTDFDGELYCQSCLESETTECSHCGERIWSSDNAGTIGFPLCQDCYDNHCCTVAVLSTVTTLTTSTMMNHTAKSVTAEATKVSKLIKCLCF